MKDGKTKVPDKVSRIVNSVTGEVKRVHREGINVSEAIWIREHIENLELLYGGQRSAAKALGIDPGYWNRLKNEIKINPSRLTLDKLGLELVKYYIVKE